jgi:Rho-binding antiterminator
MESNYVPIDCNYYDRLEAWSTEGRICDITWRDESGTRKTESPIIDLFADNSIEYMKLEKDITIRLDQLVSVNGVEVPRTPAT